MWSVVWKRLRGKKYWVSVWSCNSQVQRFKSLKKSLSPIHPHAVIIGMSFNCSASLVKTDMCAVHRGAHRGICLCSEHIENILFTVYNCNSTSEFDWGICFVMLLIIIMKLSVGSSILYEGTYPKALHTCSKSCHSGIFKVTRANITTVGLVVLEPNGMRSRSNKISFLISLF